MSQAAFLGWRVVGAAFTAQLLANACTFAVFGVFVVPLSEAFGVSQGRFGIGFSISILVMGLLGPLVGRWLDRGAARTLMLGGALLSGVGMLALSRAEQLWQMAVIFCGVVGVGAALVSPTPAITLVASWFVRRRGLALGFTVAGATVAGWIGPPIVAWLIDAFGWRAAVATLGLLMLGVGLPVFWWAVIPRPELVGQRPDGDAEPPASEPRPAPNLVSTGELVRDSRLWLLAVGFGLVYTSPIVIVLALVPFGEELGFGRQNASYFFSAMAPFSLLGKLIFGALADRAPIKPSVWLVVIGNLLVWLLLLTDPDYVTFLAIGALYGVAIGAVAPLQGVIVGLCFGREGFGRANGIGGLATLPLIAGVPALAGVLRDATGSYHAVFQLQLALVLLGGVLLQLVRVPHSGRG